MNSLLSRIIVILFLISLSSFTLANNPPTNEEIVTKTVAAEFEKLLDSLGIDSGKAGFDKETSLTSLIIDGAKSGSINAGLTVMSNDQNLSFDDYKISVSLSAFNFAYTNGKSRGLFKSAFINRELSGQMMISIIKDDFSFLGFRDFKFSDEVDPGAVNYISSIRYNQLSPKPPGGGLKKYIEPLAVTATVGGLIYLFFINR